MDVNLIRFKKSGSQRNFPLPSSVTVIGRRHNCDLRVPLVSVSRRHCQLNIDDGVLRVRDLGSNNGTYLNGKRINEAVVRPGDYIEVGSLVFVLQIDGQPETIIPPKRVAQNLPQQDMPTEDKADMPTDDTADEQLDDLTELDDLDSLEDLDALEEADLT